LAVARSLLAANFVFQNWTASSLFEKNFIPPSEVFFKQDVCFVALVLSLSLAPYSLPILFSKIGLSFNNQLVLRRSP
ncbi:MAG: hypothetical protein ACLUDL_17165, partial [Eubacterium callanderi]|uniref:hypothetical protein n=1 Tax=Eubacterium callanderi TaxID=53442 RepID=UPI003994B204